MTEQAATVSQTEPGNAADLLTEFDTPDFAGASPAISIAVSQFDAAYRAKPPWDIDGPQPAFARLLRAGLIHGRVLDIGCGTGENALHFASRGLGVTGLDASAVAIGQAQAKARQRRLPARFVRGDARQLAALGETFDTVTDSGLLHVLSDHDMQQVIRGIHAVLRPCGHYWLLCFSEHATGPGPRRLTKQHITTLFNDGWQIKDIQAARFQPVPGRHYEQMTAAWLADIERR
jgi:SAM-dependent methyltransferase